MHSVHTHRWLTALLLIIAVAIIAVAAPATRAQAPNAAALDLLHDDRWAVVAPASATPEIDGRLDDPTWRNAEPLSDFLSLYFQQPAEPPTNVRLAYSDTHLYIALEAQPGERPVDRPVYERADVILSPHATGDGYFHIPIEISNRKTAFEDGLDFSISWGSGDHTHQEQSFAGDGYVLETAGQDGHWTAEIAVPFSALGLSGINEGDEWRFNVLRHVEGDYPVTTWAPVRYSNYWDVGGFSEENGENLKNYRVRYYAAPEGRLGSLFFGQSPAAAWHPDVATLAYRTFTTKELSFKAPGDRDSQPELTLRFPTGREVAITDPEIHEQDGRKSVAFAHPPMTEVGSYQLFLRLSDADGRAASRLAILTFDDQSLIEAGDRLYIPPVDEPHKEVDYAEASEDVQRVLDLIPDKTGFRFVGMPHDPLLRPNNLYDWSPDDPHRLVAKKDGAIYPTDEYPEDQTIVVQNGLGEDVAYPYHVDAEGRRYFLSGHTWWQQREYAIDETLRIAETDPLGAARLLRRWAQVYPGYVPVNHRSAGSYPLDRFAGPPNPYWGGIWSRWHMEELNIIVPLVEAFGLVRQTNAFELLEGETGEDVERMFLQDLIEPTVAFTKQYNTMLHNITPRTWRGLITLGRVLNDPKYIHQAARHMSDFVESQYLADGFWREVALGYHGMSTRGLFNGMELIAGWSDPEGYVSPRTGQHFDDLDLLEQFPILQKSRDLTDRIVYPTGKSVPLSDTRGARTIDDAVLNTGTFHLPAAKITKLQRGTDSTQHQLWLNFTPKGGHHHDDPLSLILFAEGQELLPDIGYSYVTHMQYFYSTFAHNTVVVDGRDTGTEGVAGYGGNIGALAAVDDDLQIVQASQESGYEGVTDVYLRQPWFVGFEDASGPEGYAVDIFHVAGGDRHEYTLNMDANHDAELTTDVPLAFYNDYYVPPGTPVTEPKSFNEYGSAGDHYYGYLYLEDVERGAIDHGTYEMDLVTTAGGREQAKMKIFGFVNGDANELYLGKAVSNRVARTTGDDSNDFVKDHYMPKYVVKREGSDLASSFVTVLSPYRGDGPRIERAELLPTSSTGDVALKVTYGGTSDYLLSSPLDVASPLVAGNLRLEGRMGFVRVVDGEVVKMALIGGTSLEIGEVSITAPGSSDGELTGVLRQANGDAYDALVTDVRVPAGMAGNFVVVTHPDGTTSGFKLGDVRAVDGRTHLVLADQDPGFEIEADGSSRQVFHPLKTWYSGDHGFCIDNITTR